MMSNQSQEAIDEAIGWVIRLRHASVRDWEEFTFWLEANPDHQAAFEAVAAADEGLDELPREVEPPVTTTDMPADRRSTPRRTVLAWAVAASLVGVIGYASLGSADDTYALETLPGERQTITLAEGSRIELNGASRITLNKEKPRFARLERGEALFKVVHDQSAPFRVEAGEAVIDDLGTVFNVTRVKDLVAVEVAEGAVAVTARGQRADLSAGMTVRAEGNRLNAGRRDPASVGAWHRGFLSYSSADLQEIARDLSRSAGITVTVSPELQGQRFSGVIMLDPSEDKLMRRISALLVVEARPVGEGWLLVPAGQ